jgi:hypothetical protein
MIVERGFYLRLITDKQEFEAFVPASGKRCPCNHDARALIAAHRVNGDSGALCHDIIPLCGRERSIDRASGDCQDLAAIIMAACIAHMVRAFQLAAIGAFLKGFNLQRIMAATHAALGRRSFSFGDSHVGTCSVSIYRLIPEH